MMFVFLVQNNRNRGEDATQFSHSDVRHHNEEIDRSWAVVGKLEKRLRGRPLRTLGLCRSTWMLNRFARVKSPAAYGGDIH